MTDNTTTKKLIDEIVQELKHPSSAKQMAVSSLLSTIERVNLQDVCVSLGWSSSDLKPPTKDHYKVAIVHVLIEAAKKNNWHIIHDTGFFYIYNGAYWIALCDDEVKQLLEKAAIKIGFSEIESRDVEFVGKLFKQAMKDGFFSERHYKKQSIINLRNGSLVLSESGVSLKAFDYRDFLTHQLDFDYNETAKNEVFHQYLDRVLPDKDSQKTLQQVAGYLFIKGLKLEKVFFLYGGGANGKSVFFEVLSGVIGCEHISNYSLESLTNDNGYFRAMIKDKIVNYGTDIKLTRIDAGHFKTLASGEPIEARLPYKQPFMMTDYAKLIFNVNKLESANIEHTHGFYRRLLIIPFGVTIEEKDQDRDLHKKILQDKAGVLNWIVEGAKQVIQSRCLFESEECTAIKTQFLKETDSVAMFEEQAIKEGLNGNSYCQSVANSYREYRSYCDDAGLRNPLGRSNFTKRMEGIGFTKRKNNEGWWLNKSYAPMPSTERF
ncbi:primase [Methylococcaceae bacterium]|nr:primase [Methylococcaceae bacterium]